MTTESPTTASTGIRDRIAAFFGALPLGAEALADEEGGEVAVLCEGGAVAELEGLATKEGETAT